MKYLAVATAALLIGGSAFAQSTTTQTQSGSTMQGQSGSTMDQNSMQDGSMSPDQGMQTGTGQMGTGQTGTGQMSTTQTRTTTSQPMQGQPPMGDGVVQTNVSDGSAPERDARGIPVVSSAAAVPAGANGPVPTGGTVVPSPNQAQVFATKPATGEYPTCSRTVTDGCVQAYERGRSPR